MPAHLDGALSSNGINYKEKKTSALPHHELQLLVTWALHSAIHHFTLAQVPAQDQLYGLVPLAIPHHNLLLHPVKAPCLSFLNNYNGLVLSGELNPMLMSLASIPAVYQATPSVLSPEDLP
jgi:hypothetical protein